MFFTSSALFFSGFFNLLKKHKLRVNRSVEKVVFIDKKTSFFFHKKAKRHKKKCLSLPNQQQ